MAVPSLATSCGVCNHPYTVDGPKQPQVFACGHGACHGCVTRLKLQAVADSKAPLCQRCHQQIQAPAPDYPLIDLIRAFSASTVQSTAQVLSKKASHQENREYHVQIPAGRIKVVIKQPDQNVDGDGAASSLEEDSE